MKTIACFSGGLDSTVLLYWLHSQPESKVITLSFNYNQKHRKELRAASEITRRLGIQHEVLDLSAFASIFAGSSQTSPEIAVPEGHYEEESMKLTVVPNRNMVFLSLATAFAISIKAEAIAYAAHAGDHAIYPDCREEFTEAMDKAISLCDWAPPRLLRPFVTKSKADIVRLGASLGVPFEMTWSCYKGGEKHCGKCGTCVERREAFELAGVNDPTEYL